MAKKRPTKSTTKKAKSAKATAKNKTVQADAEPGPFELLGRRIDESSQGHAVEDAIGAFQKEVAAARNLLSRMRSESQVVGDDVEATTADLFDHTVNYIRHNPCRSVLAALLCGVVFGRLWRK